jgi:hypothetical protein
MQEVVQLIYDTFEEVGRADPKREPFADLASVKKLEREALEGCKSAQWDMAELLRTGVTMDSQEHAVRMVDHLKANGLDCTAEASAFGATLYRIVFEPAAKGFEAMTSGKWAMEHCFHRNKPFINRDDSGSQSRFL